MLALVPWLLERPGASIQEAAAAVGTTPDVVRQELEWLSYCGGPGLGGDAMFEVFVIGDRVTITMAPGLTEPLALTASEATRLVLTLAAVTSVVADRLPALGSALDKVRAAAGLQAGAVAATVEAAPSLASLRSAIAAGERVTITYRGRTDDVGRDRAVDPWQLEFTTDGWYLHGHDHGAGDHRTFLLDRIERVVRDGVEASSTVPDDLPSPQWVPQGPVQRVTVRLGPPARWIGDNVTTVRDREVDGVREISFDTDSLEWAADLVAAGGPHARVVAPPELATLVAGRARRAMATHDALRAVLEQSPA